MSLTSDIEDALLRLKSEGILLHWRDYLCPKRTSYQDGMPFQLSIQHIDSGEEISNEELVNFFSEDQLEFISNFRKAVNRNEKSLEKIFEYAEGLEEKDLGLSDFKSDQITVEFSLDNGDHIGSISNYEDPFASPKYLILTALATNPSLQLSLAERIAYYAQDAGESSNEGWVALGLVSNPNLASIHSKVINQFAPYLTNYWGDLSSLLLHAEHIENEKLDEALAFQEIYSYDRGRILTVDLDHYEWEMMRESDELDNPELAALYYAVNAGGWSSGAKSGIALLDDDSGSLVYFGEIRDSYKSSFKIVEYSDFTSKVLQPILEKSSIDLNRYTPEEIQDLFGGTSQDVWDYLCTKLEPKILEKLVSFGDQDLFKAILSNENLPKELKVLAALEEN